MSFLAAKIACSVVLALILKQSDQLGLNRMGLLRMNYAAAAILAFVLLLSQPHHSAATATYWVALLAGVSYVASLALWASAIQQSGIALTMALTRISVVVPVLFSIFLWKEVPHWYQVVGAILGLAAALLIGRQGMRYPPTAYRSPPTAFSDCGKRCALSGERVQEFGLRTSAFGFPRGVTLAALFLASGVANLSSKVFNEVCPPDDNLMFQALLFVVAFIVTSGFYFARKEKVNQRVLQWGSLLGAANLGTSVFLILALATVSGAVAFPISAAAEVAVVAVLGAVLWRERLDRLSIVGLALTVVALVLVNV
jgi:drug/metabolite transporter (DMT)-like permease